MRLGVPARRLQILEEGSEILELSEAFEQTEALTTRLRHITGEILKTIDVLAGMGHRQHPSKPCAFYRRNCLIIEGTSYGQLNAGSKVSPDADRVFSKSSDEARSDAFCSTSKEMSEASRCLGPSYQEHSLHSIATEYREQVLSTKVLFCCCVDAYVDGPGIIMELIQNADDAGASQVAFMLDNETYPSKSIFGESRLSR